MSSTDHIADAHNELWNAAEESVSKRYVPEKYQLGILTDFLDKTGAEYESEVKIVSYPIDIVALRGESIITIEMKSRNVSRGIEQARRNSDFVDFSFLALWESDITDGILERAHELPIGLLAVGESVKIVSFPTKTEKQLYPRSDVLRIVNENVRK